MPAKVILTNFTGGELSPKLKGRVDLAKYHNGCQTLENMIVLPYGGAMRRPGTYYVAEVKDSSKKVRLVAFEFSTTQAYVLEFGNLYMRVYKDSGQVMGNGDPYEITTPYTEAQLFELQFVQSADVLFIAHSAHYPRKLERTGDTSWTLSELDITNGPFLPENDSDITIQPPEEADDCTSGETFTDSSHTGAYTAAKVFNDTIVSGDGWVSGVGNVTDEWVKVEFAAQKTITKVRMQPCRAVGQSYMQPQHIKIEASNNDVDWTKISVIAWHYRCEAYNTDEAIIRRINNLDDWAELDLDNAVAYTYWRIVMADNWGDASYLQLQEVEMIEAPAANLEFTASEDLWDADHVGALWKLTHPRPRSAVSGTFAAVGDSETLQVDGNWELVTHGKWSATVEVQRSLDGGGTWEAVRTGTSQYDRNVIWTDEEETRHAWYRVSCTAYTGGTVAYDFTLKSKTVSGYIQITEYVDAQTVKARIVEELGSRQPTSDWAEGSWSPYRGYPTCIGLFEQRLALAGTSYQPQTVWCSQTGDYECFEVGDKDSDAIEFTIAANDVNAIRWLRPGRYLVLGTTGGEWTLGSSGLEEPLAPTNVSVRQHTHYGSAEIQALDAGDVLVYVQRDARHIREFVYDFSRDGYVSPEVTLLAEHIAGTGFVQMSWQRHPIPVLWVVKANGELATCTFEPSQEVAGWHRQTTDGTFESVAVIPGSAEDEVWVSVNRTIGEDTKRYVEYFKTHAFASLRHAFFVDSGLSTDLSDKKDITGITKADPGVVTAVAHGFANDEKVRITEVLGMTQVNDTVFTVKNKADDTFQLYNEAGDTGVNTSAYTTYASGGKVEKVSKSFSGLDHLEGEVVSVLADGVPHADVTVSGNAITLTSYANHVHAGLSYTSSLQPMPVEVQTQMGTAQGREKRVNQVVLRVYESVKCKLGEDTDHLDAVEFNGGLELFSGDYRTPIRAGYGLQELLVVVQEWPLPLHILAIVPEFMVYG